MRGSRKFSSGLAVGWGVQARHAEKKALTLCFSSFFFVSPQLILQRESSDHGFFKENYHSTINFQYSMEKDGPTFPGGPTFPRGRGPIAYFYINV